MMSGCGKQDYSKLPHLTQKFGRKVAHVSWKNPLDVSSKQDHLT